MNEAIRAARAVAVAKDATAIIVVPADLARVSAVNLDAFVEATRGSLERSAPAAAAGLVALVPDRHGEGTNALLVSPPALVEPSFGTASRAVHRAAAVAAGALYLEIDGPLTLDVDTGDDLLLAAATMGRPRG